MSCTSSDARGMGRGMDVTGDWGLGALFCEPRGSHPAVCCGRAEMRGCASLGCGVGVPLLVVEERREMGASRVAGSVRSRGRANVGRRGRQEWRAAP